MNDNDEKVGFGPWFVVLLFNENERYPTRHRGSKRKTEIVLHTYVHRIAGLRNARNENDNWVMQQLVGPFSKLGNARVYKVLWSKKVRNKKIKIQRGLQLLEQYGEKYKLTMWVQTQTRDEMERQRQEMKRDSRLSVTKRFLDLPDGHKMDIQSIQEMQKRRK